MAIWIWRGGPADTARYGRRGQVVPASEERREAVAARQGFLAADVPPHVVEHLRVTGGPEGQYIYIYIYIYYMYVCMYVYRCPTSSSTSG